MLLRLVDSVSFSDNRANKIRSCYEISNALAYCDKVMNLTDFKCLDSVVTAEEIPGNIKGGEIASFSELVSFSQKADICMCIFHGEYSGSHVDITIDFETELLHIVSDNFETIEAVIKALET